LTDIEVIEAVAVEHGYEPDKQPLDAWLNDRLSLLEGLGDNTLYRCRWCQRLFGLERGLDEHLKECPKKREVRLENTKSPK